MKYNIGIDPGFGATGLVLTREGEETPLRWLVISDENTKSRLVARANGLVDSCVGWILKCVLVHGIQDLAICIETPVYNGNAATFWKQIHLLSALETAFFFDLGVVPQCTIGLVNPTTSKRLATRRGNADKVAIIRASPFSDLALTGMTTPLKVGDLKILETLADAWAHSLSARTTKNKYNLEEVQVECPIVLLKNNSPGSTPLI